ncbi:hypothetical protein [Chromobacterium sp. IIBBL 290-4]|uniref:hypothetical protein n=1 Tax=Chromobacterium sp. IIBBL 290-4 TaxID=2953890 RepID=UPI0020B7F1DE|nr:hypothetical protein [Chromobacterium sp. IIBBL 290-4]UTH72821.1 hypothetical protein NKT35_14885 [Chromobacterium sp. IIBBL 290-4]
MTPPSAGLPAPLLLARQLAPLLEGLEWAIGGSSLLWRLGLEPAPRDLDIVVSLECAGAAETILDGCLQRLPRPAHADYASEVFVRYRASSGVELDLMAGIAARREGALVRWEFDPAKSCRQDALPFMPAEDWLDLYRLFDRPRRVEQLTRYLATRAQGSLMM